MAQVAVCSQTNTQPINTVWAERTVVKILNLLVHPVTGWLLKVKYLPFAVTVRLFCVMNSVYVTLHV
jgi:hypothetical protein